MLDLIMFLLHLTLVSTAWLSYGTLSFIHSTKPVEKPTELIIPLIRKNRWYKQDDAKPSENDSKENPAVQEQDSVESQAVKELIEGELPYFFSPVWGHFIQNLVSLNTIFCSNESLHEVSKNISFYFCFVSLKLIV